MGKYAYCKKKDHYKAEYRKIKCDFEEKDEDGSKKKPAETLHAKVARAESNNNNKHIHLFIAQMLQKQKAEVVER